MEKLISVCGLNCSECGAFIAEKNSDDELRRKTAEEWSKAFKSDIKAEDVRCSGCTSTAGVVFNYCRICEIRACGRKHEVANCAACPDYSCDKLTAFFAMAPAAKANLEEIRKKK
jgi:hypothetical protein